MWNFGFFYFQEFDITKINWNGNWISKKLRSTFSWCEIRYVNRKYSDKFDMWRKCDNECIKSFSWQANSVILWIVFNRWNCINYNFSECRIMNDWERFRISTHKHMHSTCTCTIMKLMSLFSLLFVLPLHSFNPYHYFHLSILRVRSFSHLTPRYSVTKSLNRGDHIVYTIYVT